MHRIRHGAGRVPAHGQGHRGAGGAQCDRARHRAAQRIARIAGQVRGTVRCKPDIPGSLGDAGYKLIVEDDGQGLSTERIKEAALQEGLHHARNRPPTLDAKQMFSLLFQSGFSTVETRHQGCGTRRRHEFDGRSACSKIGGRVSRRHACPVNSRASDDDPAAAVQAHQVTRRPHDGQSAAVRKRLLKLMIVDDSNIIRRRIERSQQIDRLEVVGAASNGRAGGRTVPPHAAGCRDHGS